MPFLSAKNRYRRRQTELFIFNGLKTQLCFSIVFLFMEPNVTNAMEVKFFFSFWKQQNKRTAPGDVAQEEMKFHYVVRCDF